MASEIHYVENDTLPKLQCVYTGVDLTGASVELHIGYAVPLVIVGTLTDEVNGEFEFGYSIGDLQTGTWEAEIQITDNAGEVITFQGLKFIIKAQIA